jgi:hypothetical protein
MPGWNEDNIKAELRFLTGELKRLREELRDMVDPPKQNSSRAFLHRQSWPSADSADERRRSTASRKPRRQKPR